MRSQASIEFMYMVMVATAMIVVFSYIFSTLYQDNLKEKQRLLFSDFGSSIRQELTIAAAAKQGYAREFDIPAKLEGYSYDIKIIGSTLILNNSYVSYNFYVPKVDGAIKKGNNIITNLNGTLCLNC
ncbi:MAG: hypothetical protein ABIJ34_02980 [archaeon]